jgi:hypothetical protein
MAKKIIALEQREGPYQIALRNVMRMVPARDRSDEKLQRLIAFRINTDGEGDTRDYLIRKIKQIIKMGYTGPMYEYLTGSGFKAPDGTEDRGAG